MGNATTIQQKIQQSNLPIYNYHDVDDDVLKYVTLTICSRNK